MRFLIKTFLQKKNLEISLNLRKKICDYDFCFHWELSSQMNFFKNTLGEVNLIIMNDPHYLLFTSVLRELSQVTVKMI